MKDIEDTFHALNQETVKRHQMAEKKPEEPTNPTKSLTDSDTSDDTDINPRLRT